MNWIVITEAASGAAGASVAVGESFRRYWARRETRTQAEFQDAVQQIVDRSMAAVIKRQADAERRQGQHLDKQDRQIAAIRADIQRFHGQG